MDSANLSNALADDITEVDIIVVGGGAAGCVIASRLSDVDSELSILVIESGPNNRNEPTITHPGLFMAHFKPTAFNKFYHSPASDALNGREAPVWVGNVLGGGTSINTVMYTRPPASDFDDWETPGWTGKDMMPYFKKLENYHGAGDAAHHGYDGPVEISQGTHVFERARDELLTAASSNGWPEHKDLQSMQPDAVHGSQRALRYVSRAGVRQDAATCYLHPRLEDGKHPNLRVLTEAVVTKIVIEGGKAVGVQFNSKLDQLNAPGKPERRVLARKLVVLSAGALGSATILERSGVGSSEVLAKAGIPVVEDLPGVGANYMDHTIGIVAYDTDLGPEDTMDAMARTDPAQLIQENNPLLGSNWQDVNIKGRPTDAEVEALGPAFKEMWQANFAHKPDKPLGWMSLVAGFPGMDPAADASRQRLGMLVVSAYPLSSGHVHITGPAASDAIDFDAGFLSDEHQLDVKMLVWAYKKSRELMRRMKSFRGEFPTWHPAFPSGSAAASVALDGPLPDDVPDIAYTSADDAAIEKFMRDRIVTMNHSMGTCKMAPREQGGVVDASLNVHGVKGLKLCDLSILPKNVAANTASTAMAIGEKAADLIIDELGLGR